MSDREHFYPAVARVCCEPLESEELLVVFHGDVLVLAEDGSLPRGCDWCGGDGMEIERLILGRIGSTRCSLLELGNGDAGGR